MKMGGTTKRVILGILAAAILFGGWWGYRAIWGRPTSIAWFFERVFIETLITNPQLLSQIGLVDNTFLDFHSGKLSDVSPAQAVRDMDMAKHSLKTLREYDAAGLTSDQKLSAKVLDWFLADIADGDPFIYHDYPVNQLFGEQAEVTNFMVTIHNIIDRRSAERYIQRLVQYGPHFDQLIESVDLRAKRSIIPPKFVIVEVLDQLRAFVATPVKDNILSTNFATKIAKVTALSEADRKSLQTANDTAIEAQVYPALNKLIAYLTNLEAKATTDDGVWKLPDGDKFYAWRLRSSTTTDMTPEQVHQLGLSEVARIEAEVTATLDAAHYPAGAPGARLAALSKDPQFIFPEGDEGRAQTLARFREILGEVTARMPEVFSDIPKGQIAVESIPAFKEKTAPGAYYQPPAMDGSRPGTFFANTGDPAKNPKWAMRTLAYHEGIPGHHFQIANATEIKGGPTFRKILPFTAYSEGWALYAERLAWEMGLENDPLDNAGRLQAELFRAVRLVVDTGIHAKHWTREQAIAYMNEHTGMPESDVIAEIERYIVMPGQACAYKIGQLKILELRERAKAKLGPKFDLKEFHHVVIGNGALPLTVLEELVDAYIASKA
jgi:uncharacterized protein (DUF885 family)